MKAVRIKFHQDTAQFRNPLMNGKNRTTFPLPPYSTMIGMVHRLCKWDTTHTINVSVMCTNERLSSPQVDRSYGWIGGNPARTLTKEFQTRWSIVVDDGSDGYMGWGRMLKNDSILVDRNYTGHINSENENELKQIYQAFLYPPIYPSLGRWEDTIRIDEVKIVNVEDEEKEEKLKAFSWLPREKCPQEVIGTIYKIPTFYTIFYERRIFDYKSCYIGNIGSSSIIRLDENGEQVLFV